MTRDSAPGNVPKTALEKKQAEKERLHQLWLVQFEKQKKTLMTGEWKHQAAALCHVLDHLTVDDGQTLIDMAVVWRATNSATRSLVLHLISSAMVELRTRLEMPPFDDPMPDEEDNAFMKIRRILA